VDEKTHEPILSILTLIVETAVKLHKDGHKVIIVSSGAVGVGLRRMDIDKRPKHMPRIQVRITSREWWELHMLISRACSCCCGTMQASSPMGQSVRAFETASCADLVDEERYC